MQKHEWFEFLLHERCLRAFPILLGIEAGVVCVFENVGLVNISCQVRHSEIPLIFCHLIASLHHVPDILESLLSQLDSSLRRPCLFESIFGEDGGDAGFCPDFAGFLANLLQIAMCSSFNFLSKLTPSQLTDPMLILLKRKHGSSFPRIQSLDFYESPGKGRDEFLLLLRFLKSVSLLLLWVRVRVEHFWELMCMCILNLLDLLGSLNLFQNSLLVFLFMNWICSLRSFMELHTIEIGRCYNIIHSHNKYSTNFHFLHKPHLPIKRWKNAKKG